LFPGFFFPKNAAIAKRSVEPENRKLEYFFARCRARIAFSRREKSVAVAAGGDVFSFWPH
jgi:hypothetical protein